MYILDCSCSNLYIREQKSTILCPAACVTMKIRFRILRLGETKITLFYRNFARLNQIVFFSKVTVKNKIKVEMSKIRTLPTLAPSCSIELASSLKCADRSAVPFGGATPLPKRPPDAVGADLVLGALGAPGAWGAWGAYMYGRYMGCGKGYGCIVIVVEPGDMGPIM